MARRMERELYNSARSAHLVGLLTSGKSASELNPMLTTRRRPSRMAATGPTKSCQWQGLYWGCALGRQLRLQDATNKRPGRFTQEHLLAGCIHRVYDGRRDLR